MQMLESDTKTSIDINDERVFKFVNPVFGQGMHLKRVESFANVALGLLHAEGYFCTKSVKDFPLPKGLKKNMQQNKWIAC